MEPKDMGKKDFAPSDPNNPMNGGFNAPPEPGQPNADTPPADNKGNAPQGNNGAISKEDYEKAIRERDALYARTKRAEEKLKKHNLSDEGGTPPSPANPSSGQEPQPNVIDAFSLAKSVASLKDYDAQEIDYAAMVAKAKNISPADAVQTPEFKYWLNGKRAEDIRNNNVPTPNSSSPSSNLPDSNQIGKMSKDEHARLEREYLAKKRASGV